jgi:predicted DNA-binding transcriptional regulator AlpA
MFNFIRARELSQRLGVSLATVWRWEKKGILPKKRRIGPNVVGWLAKDIDAHLNIRE